MVSNKDYNERRKARKKEWGGRVTEPEILVFDNFYENPMEVRTWALQEEYTELGNYPGIRTKEFPYENWKEHLEYLMGFKIHEERWNSVNYNGAFQSVGAGAKTWVHSDNYTEYTGIIFLNPYAPPNTGTSFYEHRESGSRRYTPESAWLNNTTTEFGKHLTDSCRDDFWRRTDIVQNKFNRLMVFRGSLWHSADDYFGDDLESSRLTQTFWFDRADNEDLK
jgi:hypothetical protein